MMTLTYIAAAVILLGLCIFIHELGHLLGGKMVGIKAKIFSMGYGRGFLKKTIGDTTYQVTLIPFGGYCQFYGEDPSENREGKSFEFLSAAPWRRIVTVAMGPIFNLLFGIILFYAMNLSGYTKETNKISIPAEITQGQNISPAFAAGLREGDVITGINSEKVTGFEDIQSAVMFSKGKPLSVKADRAGQSLNFTVTPKKSEENGRFIIGVLPFGNRVVVAGLVEGEAAFAAGLREMDEILEVNGTPVKVPADFTKLVKDNAGKSVNLSIMRNGKKINKTLIPRAENFITVAGEPVAYAALMKKAVADMIVKLDGMTVYSYDALLEFVKNNPGKTATITVKDAVMTGPVNIEERGFAGLFPAVAPDMVHIKYGPGSGFVRALIDPFNFIVMNVKGMGMLFSGGMSVRENVSGPIRIAKIAGDVAYYRGISAFIILMAKISIILMVMNLLPIPAVDGSHILFYAIEAVRGKPLRKEIMERIQTAGVFILIIIGVAVIANDISMLPFIQKLFN